MMSSGGHPGDAKCDKREPKHIQFLQVIGRLRGLREKLYLLRDEIKGGGANPEAEKCPATPESLASVLENSPSAMNADIEGCEKLIGEIRNLLF
jgi:hypothetical protein